VGKLIDRNRRDRAKKNRELRKSMILEAAKSTFARMPYVEVTLDAIGHRAEVDRGIASMYFGSKEELFLLLLREELEAWYRELERSLGGDEASGTGPRLAALLDVGLAERPELLRFLSLEAVVLEQNLDPMEVFRFQRWRRDRMAEVGDRLEAAFPILEAGQARRLLHRTQLIAAALRPAADPRGAAAYELGDPDFADFEVDFEAELKNIVSAILAARVKGQE
jgi:AcrR family transcriptional regulator